MTGTELMDLGAFVSGLLGLTGVAGILVIFGLYQLEEWLNEREADREH